MGKSGGYRIVLSCMPGTASDRDRDLGDHAEWGLPAPTRCYDALLHRRAWFM